MAYGGIWPYWLQGRKEERKTERKDGERKKDGGRIRQMNTPKEVNPKIVCTMERIGSASYLAESRKIGFLGRFFQDFGIQFLDQGALCGRRQPKFVDSPIIVLNTFDFSHVLHTRPFHSLNRRKLLSTLRFGLEFDGPSIQRRGHTSERYFARNKGRSLASQEKGGCQQCRNNGELHCISLQIIDIQRNACEGSDDLVGYGSVDLVG